MLGIDKNHSYLREYDERKQPNTIEKGGERLHFKRVWSGKTLKRVVYIWLRLFPIMTEKLITSYTHTVSNAEMKVNWQDNTNS